MKSSLVCRAVVLPVTLLTSHSVRRKGRACRGGHTQNRGAQRNPERAARRGPTIQRLNGRFFIDAKHRRMVWRTQIEPDDVGRLGFKLRIVACHISFQTVRFQARLLPDAMYGVFTDAKGDSLLTTTPMCGTVAGLLASGCQDPGSHRRCQHARALPRWKVSRPSTPC